MSPDQAWLMLDAYQEAESDPAAAALRAAARAHAYKRVRSSGVRAQCIEAALIAQHLCERARLHGLAQPPEAVLFPISDALVADAARLKRTPERFESLEAPLCVALESEWEP